MCFFVFALVVISLIFTLYIVVTRVLYAHRLVHQFICYIYNVRRPIRLMSKFTTKNLRYLFIQLQVQTRFLTYNTNISRRINLNTKKKNAFVDLTLYNFLNTQLNVLTHIYLPYSILTLLYLFPF